MEKQNGIIGRLAVSLGRRDEKPNQELGRDIAAKKDKKAVTEIVENLANKDKNIQGDCIKVLDEIAIADPSLVKPYIPLLVDLLSHKNNRLQWGAMAVLDETTAGFPGDVAKYLQHIISSAEKGSVITKDRCFDILVKLASHTKYSQQSISLMFVQLLKSAPNQLAMYAEKSAKVLDKEYAKAFVKILEARLPELEKESARKRIEKVIRSTK